MGALMSLSIKAWEVSIKYTTINKVDDLGNLTTIAVFTDSEGQIIEKIKRCLNNRYDINDIQYYYFPHNGLANQKYQHALNIEFYKLYEVFDFMISNGKKIEWFNYVNLNKKHIDILAKYNYDISDIIRSTRINDELAKYIIEKCDISKCRDIIEKDKFFNPIRIAFLIDKGYKLSKNDISAIILHPLEGGSKFIEFISEKSIKEWIQTYICHKCGTHLVKKDNLCTDCYHEKEDYEKKKKIYDALIERGVMNSE